MSKRIKVIKSIFESAPLLDTEDAAVIEFYDDNGNLEALISRVLGDYWCFSTKQDKDWTETLIRHGYLTLPGSTVNELIT